MRQTAESIDNTGRYERTALHRLIHAGWPHRGPQGPAPSGSPQPDIFRPPVFPGPPAVVTTRSGCARAAADQATGRAYSTTEGGRLEWKGQRWRANKQVWANSGGKYKE